MFSNATKKKCLHSLPLGLTPRSTLFVAAVYFPSTKVSLVFAVVSCSRLLIHSFAVIYLCVSVLQVHLCIYCTVNIKSPYICLVHIQTA